MTIGEETGPHFQTNSSWCLRSSGRSSNFFQLLTYRMDRSRLMHSISRVLSLSHPWECHAPKGTATDSSDVWAWLIRYSYKLAPRGVYTSGKGGWRSSCLSQWWTSHRKGSLTQSQSPAPKNEDNLSLIVWSHCLPLWPIPIAVIPLSPHQAVARWVWPLPSTKIQWPRTWHFVSASNTTRFFLATLLHVIFS